MLNTKGSSHHEYRFLSTHVTIYKNRDFFEEFRIKGRPFNLLQSKHNLTDENRLQTTLLATNTHTPALQRVDQANTRIRRSPRSNLLKTSVVDPDPVRSASFGRIRMCIVTEKTDPERIRAA